MTWDDIKNFKQEEFNCPDCGKNNISLELVSRIDRIRTVVNMPMKITSGCRCEAHNLTVGGKDDSAHLEGLAVDFSVPGSSFRFIVLSMCMRMFKRVGIGKTFIHVDIDEGKPWPVCWMY
jgi:uncharacterized protein YcbK (DUF882 family)